MNISEWQEIVHKNALDKGFTDASFGERIALIHSELSEALEDYRNGHQPDERWYENGKPEGIPIELADAVIRIMDLCGEYEIDLANAIRVKHNYNVTREYRHGNKRL